MVTLDTMLEAAARVPDHHEPLPAQEELNSSADPLSDTSSGAGSPNDCRDSGDPEKGILSQTERPKD
jgi:hypothetical protein